MASSAASTVHQGESAAASAFHNGESTAAAMYHDAQTWFNEIGHTPCFSVLASLFGGYNKTPVNFGAHQNLIAA